MSVVWHAFAAPQTLLALMAVAVLILAAVGLVPHDSLEGLNESESWLTVERGPLSRYTDLLLALGLFDLAGSVWFRLLLALVALAFVVRMIDAIDLAWRAGRRREWSALPDLPWLHTAPQVDLAVPVSCDRVWEVSTGLLEEEGCDWADVEEGDTCEIVAACHPRRLWLRPVAYAALLVAIAGLWVAATWGWQGEAWQPLPLEIQAVGRDTADAVRLDAFDLRVNARGQLVDYRSRVTWLREGAELQPDLAGIGQPARLDGVALRQISYAPVVRMRAESGDGRVLLLQMPGQPGQGREVVTARFVSLDDQPLVFLPQRERFFTLVFEEAGCAAGFPAVHIYEIEQGGQQRNKVAALLDSGQVTLDDLVLDVELSYVPVLRLDYWPGMSVAFAGAGAGLLALVAAWLLPGRLLWLCAVPRTGGTRVEVRAWPGARAGRYVRSFAALLDEKVGSDD